MNEFNNLKLLVTIKLNLIYFFYFYLKDLYECKHLVFCGLELSASALNQNNLG